MLCEHLGEPLVSGMDQDAELQAEIEAAVEAEYGDSSRDSSSESSSAAEEDIHSAEAEEAAPAIEGPRTPSGRDPEAQPALAADVKVWPCELSIIFFEHISV